MSESMMQKMLDKVQKLLALAGNNPNEEEATQAALKAQQLIAEYNLTLPEDGPKVAMAESRFYTGGGKRWKSILANILAENFRCKVYWTTGKQKLEYAVFFGYEHDTKVCVQVFEFLFKLCEKKATAKANQVYKMFGTRGGAYLSYAEGFMVGVKKALDVQSVALMIVVPTEVKDAYAEKTNKFKTFQSRSTRQYGHNPDAYKSGVQDGQDAMTRRKLEAAV